MFTSRWWRFSFFDRFDRFDVDVARLERSIEQSCPQLVAFDAALNAPDQRGFAGLLEQTAEDTIIGVRAPLMVCLLGGPRFGLAPQRIW